MDFSVLKNAGLSEHEAEVYAKLMEHRICTASALAKIVRLNRTTTYLQLDRLKDLGLVSYVIKNGKRYFQPADPQKLIDMLDERKKKITEIVPVLRSLRGETPQHRTEVYEGLEGVKTFYEDVIKTEKDVSAFGVTGKAFEVLKYNFPHYLKRFKKAGIRARYISNLDARKALKEGLNKNFEIRFLPKEVIADVTTVIYGNKIAIQSLVDEQFFVIVVDHAPTKKSYQMYFDFLWKMSNKF